MVDTILNCVNKFYAYFGTTGYFMLYMLAVVLLLMIEKDKLNKQIFIGHIIIFSIIYWCPITAYIITRFCVGTNVYWRMFWMLPITILIGYVFTRTISMKLSKSYKIIVVIVLCIAIIGSGRFIYNENNFQPAENWLKIEQDAIDVAQIIENDSKIYGIENRGVIPPKELAPYIKQYDGIIRMAYGRDMLHGTAKKGTFREQVYRLMSAENINVSKIRRIAKEEGYQYLVYGTTVSIEEFEKAGYRWVGSSENYNVYCIETEVLGWK